jgi:hypothetical protein
MTFHEYLSKAVQDDAQLAAERGRLLLVARRGLRGAPHACRSCRPGEAAADPGYCSAGRPRSALGGTRPEVVLRPGLDSARVTAMVGNLRHQSGAVTRARTDVLRL